MLPQGRLDLRAESLGYAIGRRDSKKAALVALYNAVKYNTRVQSSAVRQGCQERSTCVPTHPPMRPITVVRRYAMNYFLAQAPTPSRDPMSDLRLLALR